MLNDDDLEGCFAATPRRRRCARGNPWATWTTQVIQAIIKCSIEMQNDLCGKRLVGTFVEWCDTPIVRKRGSAPTDGCWLFAESDGCLRSVVLLASHDVYLAVPHPSSDPVMAANRGRS